MQQPPYQVEPPVTRMLVVGNINLSFVFFHANSSLRVLHTGPLKVKN